MLKVTLNIKFVSIALLVLGIVSILSAGLGLWYGRSALTQIRAQGYLVCGISDTVGFGDNELSDRNQDRDLEAQYPEYDFYLSAKGFEADFCQTIAIAVLNSAKDRIRYVPLTADNRFDALKDGAIDVLFRISTCTAGREAKYGLTCGPVIFPDEQRLLVRRDLNLETLAGLEGKTICVLGGQTTSQNLLDNGLTIDNGVIKRKIEVTPIVAKGTTEDKADAQLKQFYEDQDCIAVFGTIPRLVDLRDRLDTPDEHILHNETIIAEPMTPYIVARDEQWRKVVEYAIFTTLYAEKRGVTKTDVGNCDDATSKEWFLGTDDLANSPFFGEDLGLDKGFGCQIIKQLGNYGEIYHRHLASHLEKSGVNRNWELYFPPLTPP